MGSPIKPSLSPRPLPLPITEEGRPGWRGLFARLYNLFQYLFDILLDLCILESNHTIAVGFKLFSTDLIAFSLLHMDAAVNLDDEPMLSAIEISDEWS